MIEYELIQQRAVELRNRAEHARLVREARETLPGRGRRFGGLLGRLGGAAGRPAGATEQGPVTARLGEC